MNEQKVMTLPEFLDSLEGAALSLLQNIRTAKEGARLQGENIKSLEAKVKTLETKTPTMDTAGSSLGSA